MPDYQDNMERANWKLKARIVETFETQGNFADFMGLHEARVSQVVRGKRRINMGQRKAWAKALGVKVREIF